MVLRLLFVALLFTAGFALYLYLTRRQIARLAAMQIETDSILRQLKPGVPAIVYFTTPTCIPCQTQQMPALTKVRETLGDDEVQIIKIDATEDTESADRWGVLSAPTTFIVDAQGKTRAVNHGVADAEKLHRQILLAAS